MPILWGKLAAGMIFCAFAAGAQQEAADWPHTRGLANDGHVDASNLALPWPSGKPTLLWKTTLGDGYSGVIAVDGRLYTQAQTRSGQYVVCLDADSGRVLWQTRYNYPWENAAAYPGPYAAPTYSAGKLYFVDCYGFAGCMEAQDGKQVWSVNLTDGFGGKGTGFGYASPPLVEEGRVFLPVGGKGASVVAFSAQTGSVLWQTGDDPASYVPCLTIRVEGHPQVISFLQNVLVAHDPSTGKELWRDRWSNDGYDEHSTVPLYQEPLLYCSGPFRRGGKALKLWYDGTAPKATLIWQNKSLCNDVLSAVLVEGFVYGSALEQTQASLQGTRSRFKCVELATGRERWTSEAPGHASVVACGNKLLLLNEEGVLRVIEADPAAYRELAQAKVIEGTKPCWTAPTVYGGRLFVRNQQALACYQIGPLPQRLNSVASATAPAGHTRAGGFGSWLTWLDKHQGAVYWSPSLAQLNEWYWVCLGLLALSGGAAWQLRRLGDGRVVFLVLSAVLGLLALPALSVLADHLIFTWPLACHAFLLLVLLADARDSARDLMGIGAAGYIRRRLGLVSFGIFCVVYYVACQRFFLPCGIGFLCGLAPASLVAYPLSGIASKPDADVRAAALLTILSFSVYFWGSVLVMGWRMRG